MIIRYPYNLLLMNARVFRLMPLLLLAVFGDFFSAMAQLAPYKPKDPALYKTIVHMDSVCFAAFNAQDVEALKLYFSPDLEFYNDGGDVTGFAQTMLNFKAMFARNKSSGLRREVVAGSLEVYPLHGYGAIEEVVHRFIHVENGKEEVGTMKFVCTWQLKDGAWRMTRVISYNH